MAITTDVTVYRKTGRDAATRADTWQAAVYRNAHLFYRVAATAATRGTDANDAYILRIFGDDSAPCAIGDVVAVGICPAETPAQAQSAGAACFTVLSITDNRRGSKRCRHWRLEGK